MLYHSSGHFFTKLCCIFFIAIFAIPLHCRDFSRFYFIYLFLSLCHGFLEILAALLHGTSSPQQFVSCKANLFQNSIIQISLYNMWEFKCWINVHKHFNQTSTMIRMVLIIYTPTSSKFESYKCTWHCYTTVPHYALIIGMHGLTRMSS